MPAPDHELDVAISPADSEHAALVGVAAESEQAGIEGGRGERECADAGRRPIREAAAVHGKALAAALCSCCAVCAASEARLSCSRERRVCARGERRGQVERLVVSCKVQVHRALARKLAREPSRES